METTSNETMVPARLDDVTEYRGIRITLGEARLERIEKRHEKRYGAELQLGFRLDGVRDRNLNTEAAIIARFSAVRFCSAYGGTVHTPDRKPIALGPATLTHGVVSLYGSFDYLTGTVKLFVAYDRPKLIPSYPGALLAALQGVVGGEVQLRLRDELLLALWAAIDTADDQKSRERDARSATHAAGELLTEARKIARERVDYAARRAALEAELNAAEVDAVHALTLETQAKCDASGTYTQEDGVTLAPRVIAAALKHAAKCITGGWRPAFGREWDEVSPEEV